ncbi:hypothetical protein M758_4G189800 [Ceratodon purpureus]|uniref:Uncharacterized protein n=1 Tax=Ceratodon purpureus TaxID=3225 RepID=A0A8T0ICP3_CERPU|nr:hypothetical protein KC19_4G186600 [Ceratodon purpureus]KAG0620107.1 hypothetical protein M758_4G189800 [Ceratodon purpureus]
MDTGTGVGATGVGVVLVAGTGGALCAAGVAMAVCEVEKLQNYLKVLRLQQEPETFLGGSSFWRRFHAAPLNIWSSKVVSYSVVTSILMDLIPHLRFIYTF